MLVLCWAAYRQRGNRDYIDYFALSLRLIGTTALSAYLLWVGGAER